MKIFHLFKSLFKKKSEFEEYMELLKQSVSSGTCPMPPWMSMPYDQFEKAHKEYLKTTGK
jgi:hypothetical protein